MRNGLIALAAVVLAVPAFGETAGGVTWTAPTQWKTGEPRAMRVVTYKIAAAKGDTEDAECAVHFFGEGQGGAVDLNLQRWMGQFEQPDGKKSADVAKTQKKTVNGLSVTLVDVSGTYTGAGGPMSMTPPVKKPGYRLLGAIVEGPQGSVFFKLTGPAKTVAAAKAEFDKLIGSLKR